MRSLFHIITAIIAIFRIYSVPAVFGTYGSVTGGGGGNAFGVGLTQYEQAVKSGVFDQIISIDYDDAIYTDKKMNARLLFIIESMNSKPAGTSIVRGFQKTLQQDLIYASNATQATPGAAGAAYTIELLTSAMKDQVQEQATLELDYTPAAGYTNYVYVPETTGKAGTATQLIVKPIDPTLIVGKAAGAGNGVPANCKLNVTGTWFGQGTGSVKALSFFPEYIENYVQEQKTPYEYATLAAKENLYVKGTLKNMLDDDAKRSHLLLKEKTLLFNGPAYKLGILASTDTVQIGYMGGLIYNLRTYSPNYKTYSVWSYDTYDEFQYTLFDPERDDDVGKRLLVCNKAMRKFFTDLKKDKPGIDWAPNGTYGIPGIRTVVSDAGQFDVMVHPRIHARYPDMDKPFGMALYLPYIQHRPMEPTQLTTNIQANDVRSRKSEYYSAWTYLMYQPVYHGLLEYKAP